MCWRQNTGGFAALNRNDFNTAFDRIVQENSQYYLLRLLLDEQPARRTVPQDRGAREAARAFASRAPASGYYEPRGRRPADPVPGTNPALSRRRFPARCRWPACR